MKIVTHRFRGFGERENSLSSFKNALENGVICFEFDVRVTADGIPVVNHDPFFRTDRNNKISIIHSSLAEMREFQEKSGMTDCLPDLAEILEEFGKQKRTDSRIFIDIKDFGQEEKIYSMLSQKQLLPNSVIVSWLPEVLFAFHKIDPTIPLCFSHNYTVSKFKYGLAKLILGIEKSKNTLATMTKLFSPKYAEVIPEIKFYFDDYNDREFSPGKSNTTLPDFEHTLNGPVSGRLMEIINESKGYLCINHFLLDHNYPSLYKHPVSVIPYSLNSESAINSFLIKIKPDYILSDNPALVSKF
ncbi:MAG: glycerophosphodiester phosphodiesterase [Ignavibacteria bacterium]|nr:glycerophosphodiester phosphodiesterase [Ignavibacteria bacterium]